MEKKRILIIHPFDKSTFFLERIKNHLQLNFGNDVHYFSVKLNDYSHKQCLERIQIHPSNGLIIFLGHGRSDKLYGSKANEYSLFVDEEAAKESPEKYYYNDNFINEENIEIFREKKVFCLACNSAEKLANLAIAKGATSFLGFGNIPTSSKEFEDNNEKISNDFVVRIKTELNYIIKTSLVLCLKKHSTFEELLNHIHFITSQRIAEILINQKNFKERYILVNYLYQLKSGAKIIGDNKLKILD